MSLFNRAWVAAFLLHMFTDAIIIEGCTAIKEQVHWQHQVVGARESVIAELWRTCLGPQRFHYQRP